MQKNTTLAYLCMKYIEMKILQRYSFEAISTQSFRFLSMFISVKRFEIQKVPEVKIIFCYKTSFPFIHKQC